MDPEVTWNVFVPHLLLDQPSGYLIGFIDSNQCLIYINGCARSKSDIDEACELIGFWSNPDDRLPVPSKTRKAQIWATLEMKDNNTHCILQASSGADSFERRNVVVIQFEPSQVMKSFVLSRVDSSRNSVLKDKKFVETTEGRVSFAETISQRLRSRSSNIPPSSQFNKSGREYCIATLMEILSKCDLHQSPAVHTFYCRTRWKNSPLSRLPLFLMQVLLWVDSIVKTACKVFQLCCSPFPTILHTPSIVRFLQNKATQWRACLQLDQTQKFNRFLLFNCYTQQLVDSSLGIAIIILVSAYSIHISAAEFVLDWADGVARQLTDLVQWLMGAPAGLKLNAQLTKFLGHFFIYHIYLWTGYVTVLRDYLPWLVWACSLVGALGVSAQICLLQDLLSTLTLHIYCFYVYAAKLFSIQVYSLRSLWRLFRGKKWNVLRARVDSAVYSTDQLFVGTLLFTLMLFLLPTTLLYYSVFTLLRLSVLGVQGCLSTAVDMTTSLPAFSLLLKLFSPKLVAGNVKFSIKHASENNTCLVLNMQTCQIPLSQLLQLTSPLLQPADRKCYTWSHFLSHLATGSLIYPWVEPRHPAIV